MGTSVGLVVLFMVSNAPVAAVWEDQKDIRPPMYEGNPVNLDRFLEKLEDQGMTVTESMDPAAAKKCVLKRFRCCLAEVLQELYFLPARERKHHEPQRGQEVVKRAGQGRR